MTPVRIAVIGAGHLGRHHARLLQELDQADLVTVVDTRESVAREVAAKHGAMPLTDYREVVGRVQAACVVTPTATHHEVAGYLLEHGIDVLVEKPITLTEPEGLALVETARRLGRVLQVGHVERFNPALAGIAELGMRPRYIESQRLAPFSFRSVDAGVVLDLMVHDIDLVLHLVGSEVTTIEAFGGAVFTPAEDMATAILRFENGAVANLTASRIALKPLRKMRLFAASGYASLDFQAANGTLIRKSEGWDYEKLDLGAVDTSKIEDLWKFVFDGLLTVRQLELGAGNPLSDELAAFLRSVVDRSTPPVTGEDGVRAVRIAHRILDSIRRNRW